MYTAIGLLDCVMINTPGHCVRVINLIFPLILWCCCTYCEVGEPPCGKLWVWSFLYAHCKVTQLVYTFSLFLQETTKLKSTDTTVCELYTCKMWSGHTVHKLIIIMLLFTIFFWPLLRSIKQTLISWCSNSDVRLMTCVCVWITFNAL